MQTQGIIASSHPHPARNQACPLDSLSGFWPSWWRPTMQRDFVSPSERYYIQASRARRRLLALYRRCGKTAKGILWAEDCPPTPTLRLAVRKVLCTLPLQASAVSWDSWSAAPMVCLPVLHPPALTPRPSTKFKAKPKTIYHGVISTLADHDPLIGDVRLRRDIRDLFAGIRYL